MPSKFCGYARVSTQRQAESGLSIDAQKAALEAYYKARYADTHVWGGVYTDPEQSGGKPFATRPAGGKLLDRLDPGDVLVVNKLDRAFRNTRDALVTVDRLAKRRVSMVFMDIGLDTTTPIGKCLVTMLAAFAELERDFISQRVKAAIARSPRKKGTDMFGWRPVGKGKYRKLVPFPEIRKIAATLVALRDRGMTYYQIRDWCKENGIKNPLGRTRKHTLEHFCIYKYVQCETYLQWAEGRRAGPRPELLGKFAVPLVYPEGWEVTYAKYLISPPEAAAKKDPGEAAELNGQAH